MKLKTKCIKCNTEIEFIPKDIQKLSKEESNNIRERNNQFEEMLNEKETKRKLPELESGENYCGCCRMKVKTSSFDKHTQTS